MKVKGAFFVGIQNWEEEQGGREMRILVEAGLGARGEGGGIATAIHNKKGGMITIRYQKRMEP